MAHDYWRELRDHSEVKHQILKKYLVAWIQKLGSAHSKLLYVDGFAGKGKYEDGSLGSPLIAIQVANDRYKKGEFFCVFVESDKSTFLDLEREIRAVTVPSHIRIITKQKEFADVASEILDEVPIKNMLVPSFWFIDPFGIKGVPLTLVQRILQYKQAEIFFRFSSRDISRFLTSPYHTEALKKIYNSDCWQEAVPLSGQARDLRLRDLYIRRLKEEEIARFVNSFKVTMPNILRTAYHLIHATNHFDGFKIMKDIMYGAGTPGTFAYLGPEEGQLRLFSQNLAKFKEYLINRFKNRVLTFDRILEEFYEETDLIEKHYRHVLKELEKEGRIRVERSTSKTERGLGGQDKITFL